MGVKRSAGTDTAISLAVAALLGAVVCMATVGGFGLLGQLLHDGLADAARSTYALTTIVGLAGIGALELLFPARDRQRVMSPSYVIDAFYVYLQTPITIAATLVVLSPLHDILGQHASGLVIDGTDAWPTSMVFVLGLMLTDFLGWLSHVVIHRVRWFWRFHMIHHSQRQLNPFTANRTHPVDGFVGATIRFLPLYFIAPSMTEQAATMWLYGLAITWHIRFQHSNIRWSLGPLRYVFVTPQSHRIHHSTDPRHWDSNYSNIFSLWDRLFGTHIDDPTMYPETGISAPDFPEPSSYSPREILGCFGRQMAYPLTRAARGATNAPARPRAGVPTMLAQLSVPSDADLADENDQH